MMEEGHVEEKASYKKVIAGFGGLIWIVATAALAVSWLVGGYSF